MLHCSIFNILISKFYRVRFLLTIILLPQNRTADLKWNTKQSQKVEFFHKIYGGGRQLLSAAIFIACSGTAQGEVGVKTNLLSDATLSPNIGVELPLAPQWSVEASGGLNAWTVNGHRWRHWLVQPEVRYWLCDRFAGHFFGVHLLGGQYNIGNINLDFSFLGTDFSKLSNNRYQGWFGGAGIAYGYTWILSRHWSIEAEIGVGWTYTRYDKYRCADCGKKIESNHPHNYVGPTKAALNMVYVF